MIGWSGSRKLFTVLLFVLPTMLGVAIVSLYPMIYNLYISFTNRNRFHPVPDCTNPLTSILDPTCWTLTSSTFKPRGAPYELNDPIWKNYQDLLGELFSVDSLVAILLIAAAFIPVIIAYVVVRRLSRRTSSPATWPFWLAGIAATIVLWFALGTTERIAGLMATGPFIYVMTTTVAYVIACIPLFFIMGLTIALVLNEEGLRGRGLWRMLLIVPWAVPSYITALIWQFFFRDQGTINQILAIFGIDGPAWLNNPLTAFAAVVIINVWLSYPFFMVTILGALQSIPQDMYEAADVDGANYFQKLFSLTLPMLRPAVLPAIVLSSITTFQMFNTVYLVTKGGPIKGAGIPGATEFVMVYAYKQVFNNGAYGLAGAFAVIVFVMLFIATLYSLRITRLTQGANA
jgi:arabinogalactan oligomer/maltooligosaccharide transport system permease protein